MTSARRIPRAALVLAAALAGCVDADCPAGSKSVDGICKTIDAGGFGGQAAPGNVPFQPPDDPGLVDGGSQDAGGAAQQDAAPPRLRCADLECDEHASCSEESGSAVCTCEEGYEGDGTSCRDIDECDDGSHDCDVHAECTNEQGSYTCECEDGYEGDGEECEANPCEPRVNPCDGDTTTCRDEDGEAVCECLEGFGRCEDDPHSCETDLMASEDHCGECGAACAGSLSCDDGVCEQAVVQLTLGNLHSCALTPDGEILCWGKNDYGQLARAASSTAPTYEPTPTKHGAARLLSADTEVTCALLEEDDELVCSGYDALYWIDPRGGQGDFTLGDGLTAVDALEVGALHACLRLGERVWAWGLNNYEVLGPSGSTIEFPERVERADDVVKIAAGVGDCAIGTDERVRCWGNDVAVPTEVVDVDDEPIEGARDIAVSSSHSTSCAAIEDGSVLCWGFNENGQLGNVDVTVDDRDYAVPVTDQDGTPMTGLIQVAVGGDFACARHEEGRVFCWGRRDRLGGAMTGSAAQRYATEVSEIDDAVEVAAGDRHACARRRNGQVQCWGDNASGQLGVSPSGGGGISSASTPVDVIGLP